MNFLTEPVPNEEAADFIKSKPAIPRAVFDRLLPELKARAFAVTGLESATAVQNVRDAIAELPRGGDWDKIKTQIASQMSPYLIDDDADQETQAGQKMGADRRAELLLRLHGFQAYSAAAYRALDEQRDVFPYWQYKSMGDGRVRATHSALNDIVLPAGDPFWRGHYPPWEWGCRCQVVGLMDIDVEEIRDAEKDKPLEERTIIEGEAYRQLTEKNILVKGPNLIFDVRTPQQRGAKGGFGWDPADLRLDLAQLRSRYDDDVWQAFETWARGQEIPGQGRTVWDWMTGDVLAPASTEWPDLASLKKISALGGSTGATLMQAPDGRRFVVKRGNSAEHIREEATADAIYRALGVPVPEARLVETPDGPVKIAEFVQGTSLKSFLQQNPANADAIYARIREHFIVDALLGNWDVAGLDLDNILVDPDGIPWRIDNGGSLRYRAQGKRKSAAEWGDIVTEIDTLRDPNRNPVTAKIFAGLTDAQIRSQIEDVLTRRDDILAAAPPELHPQLTARLDNLAARLAPPGSISPQFAADVRAARILGRTYLGDKELIEDHSILLWQETGAGGEKITRAKLRLTEAGVQAIRAKIGATLATAVPASLTGPQPLATDTFWPPILAAVKTVNVHTADGNYNAGTIAAFEQAANALDQFKPKTAEEKAMKAAYAAAIADVRSAMAARTQTQKHSQFLWTPPPPNPAAQSSRVRAEAGEMVYPAKVRARGHATEQSSKVKAISGAYRLTVGDVEITFAPWDSSIPYAHRGMTTIRVQGEATADRLEAITAALTEIGVDASPTPPETSEIVYIAKTLRFAKPDGDWNDILSSPKSDAEKLAELKTWTKKKLRIDLDKSPDYKPGGRANAWGDGWRTWERFDLPPEKLRAELPGYGLTHSVHSNLPAFIDSLLDGGGQITPTMERMRVGVPIGSGMSPDADQGTGGANYFFTRIADPTRVARHRGMVFKIDLLARTDAYSFPGDYFGDVRPQGQNTHTTDPQKSRGRTVADYKRFAAKSSNETILKNSVNLLEDVEVIQTASAAEKQAVLQIFAKHGISHLPDGRAITDIIK